LANLLRIPATSSLRVALKQKEFLFFRINNEMKYLPKLFRCLNVRVSTLDEDGIVFFVNNFVLKFYLSYNLKDKQENNEDIIINKGNIHIYRTWR
jgi:hypothetical protein